jgi:hypothetical protein
MRQEYFAVNGEYADRQTAKLSLSRRIFAKNKKKSYLKSSHQSWSNGQENYLTLLSL